MLLFLIGNSLKLLGILGYKHTPEIIIDLHNQGVCVEFCDWVNLTFEEDILNI